MPGSKIQSPAKSKYGKLFLMPSAFAPEQNPEEVIPLPVLEKLKEIKVFIVEEMKTARRFLKKVCKKINIDALEFLVYNEHNVNDNINEFIRPLKQGKNVALLSEAGLPCVADPGNRIVAEAHRQNIEVVPLSGASSIILALVASGFNGQSFAFHGYLPVDKPERNKKIRQMEQNAAQNRQTQIFIETPYRNNQLIQAILDNCKPDTLLCVAVDITLPSQQIITKPVKEWKKKPFDFHKRPAVFLISV